MINQRFRDQVDLLLEVLGPCLHDERLALKGGTAINLFYQDMPRLSVDIDLTYVCLNERTEFIKELREIFEAFQTKLKQFFPEVNRTSDGIPKQLRLSNRTAQIKIDVNLVLRGTVYPTEERLLCQRAQDEFQKMVKVRCVSFEDIYAGKFCAALDRQHPRDLYDVRGFFEKFTFTEKLKKAFLVYLISGNRPISEMIHPTLLDQRSLYDREFVGMSYHDVSYADLEQARMQLIQVIDDVLTPDDHRFLLSFKEGAPLWDLLGIKEAHAFPGIKWKLQNIKKMDPHKHRLAIDGLKRKLKID
jgi:predicted nucleotidyltransferase component of viral defense system